MFRLQWNEDDFNGSSVIRVNPSKIWLPDIEVYNMAVWKTNSDSLQLHKSEKKHFKGTSQLSITPQFYTGSNVLIYPDGEVLFIPQISLKVHCANFSHSNWPQVTNNLIINIVLSSFEKGEQVCNIKLGSWTHDGLILNLTLYNNKVPIGNKLGLSKARI